jgi:hypothetical protein
MPLYILHKQHIIHKKIKWATFTYCGPEIISITNLFRNTDLNIAFNTTITIKQDLKSKRISKDTYNQSGIYQLKCSEYPLTYIGQTGHALRVRYREHITAIKDE